MIAIAIGLIARLSGAGTPPGPTSTYRRPGGVDTYRRPDGTSIYVRP